MADLPSGEFSLVPVGWVSSPLTERAAAPRQPDEGAPPARILLDAAYRPAAADLRPGDRIVVLTWLHLADRTALSVHPRGEPGRPVTGVFSTRSPDRPNPVGLHVVSVVGVAGDVVQVDRLEAVDGTPVIDIKPILGPVEHR